MSVESAHAVQMLAASARGVGVCFGPAAALAEVDADVPRGAVTALIGPNGAGKTTLLRVLAGFLLPSAGAVEILGAPPAAVRSRGLRSRIGYIPQEAALDPELTGRETLWLLAALYGVPRRQREERIAGLARAFGTVEPLARPVASWSGGLKRRLHLAAGMIHDPELLLLDEPTAGLDLEGSEALWSELERRAGAGRAVAVVTHDLAAVERHARQVILLNGGRVAAVGAPEALRAVHGTSSLSGVYRHLTGRDPERPPRTARTGGQRGEA